MAVNNIKIDKRPDVINPCSVKQNLTQNEHKAIKSLINPNIVIKEADKGSAVVLMDTTFYVDKVSELLNDKDTYIEIPKNIDRTSINKIKKMANIYKDHLTRDEIQYLTNFEFRTSLFYGLPKIHKSKIIIETVKHINSEYIRVPSTPDLKLRPIVAGPTCPTHRLSHFLDIILQPFLNFIPSYLKNNLDFLNILPKHMKDTEMFITLDVVSLYSNITHELGFEAINYWVTKYNNGIGRIPANLIIDGCMLVLENNSFEFNGKNYLQISGTAMGTKFAPNYANLVLGYLESILFYMLQTKFGNDLAVKFRSTYKRYLDDVFIIWDTLDGDFQVILDMMNELNHKIKFTWDSKGDTATFLDIRVLKIDGEVVTDIFYKETDTKQYLEFSSNHPRHIKNNIPFNLARRICTIVVEPEIREIRLRELHMFLLQRRYPTGLIENGILRAKTIPLSTLRNPNSSKDTNENTITYITTYNPLLEDNFRYIQTNFQTLQKNPETADIYKDVQLIRAKRQPQNLKRILTKAKLPTSNDACEVNKCNTPRCKLCKEILMGSTFHFPRTNEIFRIKRRMDCNTQNCIYVLCCQGCDKIYIGETANLRARINLHRNHILHNTGLDVSKHIHQCAKHNDPKFKVMPFYKVQSDNMNERKDKETYFINKYKPDLNKIS